YGWAKTFTNVSRTGLPGDAIKRDFSYFGSVETFLQDEPTILSDPTYNKMARGFYEELQRGLSRYHEAPLAFLVRQFNGNTTNAKLLDQTPAPSNLIKIGDDLAVVTGPNLATPSPDALAAARRAERQTAALYANHPGPLGNLGHTLRVLLGLALLIALPGAIAAPWFDLEDGWVRVALVPALSFALVVLSGIALVSVTRGPYSTADGWATLGIAVVAAGALRLGKARLDRAFAAVSRFFAAMFEVFSNRSFAALMGTQFVALAADGIVQASLAKSIAFGGQKGFDVTSAP